MTEELFNEICDEIGITTDSVKSICDRKGIAYSTFWRQIKRVMSGTYPTPVQDASKWN